MNLSATQAAILAALRKTIDAGEPRSVKNIGANADPPRGATVTREALQGLADHGVITRTDASPGRPADYEIRATPPPDPSAPPVDPSGLTPPAGEIPSRGRADGPPSPPPSRPPATAPSRPLRPSAPPEGSTPPAPPADADVVQLGQAVVAWAVAEQQRLDKPKLDDALLRRIGSVAKRMFADGKGVAPAELKLAVETLVDRDMTDLQAAHRRAQSAASAPIVPGRRAAAAEVDALAAAAAESKRGRSPSLRPHEPGEFVEVWAFIAATWGTIPPPAEQAMWDRQLRTFPVDGVIWALRELAIGGEHKRFAPTWGEVYRVGIPELRSRRRREADLLSEPE